MEQTNRKYMAIIAFLKKFINVFFNLFFNIYILQIVNNDLNFIIKYTIFGAIVAVVYKYILFQIMNSKNIGLIYRLSFILQVSCVILLIVLKENIIDYIYWFKALEILAGSCYSNPYEVLIIGSNTNKTMSTYLANLNILESFATIITPVFAGFMIEKFSYEIFFIFLIFEALLMIAVSLQIKEFAVSDEKMQLSQFWKITKKKKHLQDIYQCMLYRRISAQGAIVELLPIILFLRLGTELDFGAYQSLFALVAMISLQILKIINQKNIEKKFYPYFAIVIFVASVIVVYNTSFVSLLIYYLLMNSLGVIIESESCSAVYAAIRTEDLVEYKKEHIFIFGVYMLAGQLISYSLVYILYNNFYQVNSLSIAVSMLMFFLIIATIYLRKTQEYLFKLKEEIK